MQTAPVTFVLLLAIAAMGSAQVLGGPGTEPWSFVVLPACQMKSVTTAQVEMGKAQQCIAGVTGGGNPMNMCSKKKERNDCLKPYYEEIKKCFSTDDQKKQVDTAFKAQKEAVEYFCKDDMKAFKGLTKDDLECKPKEDKDCPQNLMKEHMPDMSQLFAENNCEIMHGMAKCTMATFEDCKSTAMADIMMGQMNAILGETPCGEANGVSSSLNAFVAPILLFCLVCHGVMKAFF